MKKKRLTTDNPTSLLERACNKFYIDNEKRETMCRYGYCQWYGDGKDITLRDLIRHCAKILDCEYLETCQNDEELDEVLFGDLEYGYDNKDGILAHFYVTAWTYSELREKLKEYEDKYENEIQLLDKLNIYKNEIDRLKWLIKSIYKQLLLIPISNKLAWGRKKSLIELIEENLKGEN